MKKTIILAASLLAMLSCKQENKKADSETEAEMVAVTEDQSESNFEIFPIEHATTVLNWDGKTIYVDPVGEVERFSSYGEPDYILVTDIHGDHLNATTIEGIMTPSTKIVVPQAVAEKLPESFNKEMLHILNNGENWTDAGFDIAAIPMYNLREEALKFHTKGRGNGYVIERAGKRVYFSGDTEDIPEMRNLENIDVAFVCMNLPYTMTVESAASAVLDFKPETVYPYHFRGTDGMSDVSKFKDLVNEGDSSIKVELLEWYPSAE